MVGFFYVTKRFESESVIKCAHVFGDRFLPMLFVTPQRSLALRFLAVPTLAHSVVALSCIRFPS